ncbi:MAG: valine--tRNA ligase [Bacteroidetes bacterium]|nr:valine--tRNA ligase [Bacteroidota bacterium]
MELAKTYAPIEVEKKWYGKWMEKNIFHSVPDGRKAFTIVIPPPNVTGILHMGHALNNTIQDLLVRRARMQGFNACWVPGTDHASIATEAKVVAMLKEKGINKNDLTREEFLKYAWEWKEKYGGIILQQLKKLGASCDWDRVAFTMDDDYYKAVIKVFVDLYNKGHIHRGVDMINWDPQAQTALSDEEVNFKEVQSRLHYLKYKIEGTEETITIATTRPETILGDTAICVHPNDERYKNLVGKMAIVPLINRAIPIITDEYVDREFGTGALKITPAHDKNDYALGKKHNLATIDIFNANGTLNEAAQLFIGKDRFDARRLIVKQLEAEGFLVKIEDIKNNVGYSERTNAVVEPRLSQQWFCKMKELAKPALENVMNQNIKFHPIKYQNTYRHWMDNIRDWCVSRQLWWGHRIPAYYAPDGTMVVAENIEEALQKLKALTNNQQLTTNNLKQDDDCLDTWFSSWLWPIEVFKGISNPGNAELNYYYPTQVLVTAPEIIFFWVARMIMAGYEYENKLPFENVYFTGIVRDKQGRKMSKSLGNSPDLLELIDTYGADGVRFGILVCSPAGNDLLFDEKLCEQGRNFNNKIWNALRLVKGWEDKVDASLNTDDPAISWFENRLRQAIEEINSNIDAFRISEALTITYKLIWDDFCAWYLELVKPKIDGKISKNVYDATIYFFEELMKLLHPFMPFASEEIWQQLQPRTEDEFCAIAPYPIFKTIDENTLSNATKVFDLVVKIRAYRSSNNLSPKEPISLFIKAEDKKIYNIWEAKISKLANIESYSFTDVAIENAEVLIIKTDEIFIPRTMVVNAEEEKIKIEKELEYTRGFLQSVLVKLGNERFVQNAKPELVQNEVAKKEDAEARIRALEESLTRLN